MKKKKRKKQESETSIIWFEFQCEWVVEREEKRHVGCT